LMVGFVDVMGDALGADVDLPDRHDLLVSTGRSACRDRVGAGASTHSRGSRNQQEYGAPTDRALRFLADRWFLMEAGLSHTDRKAPSGAAPPIVDRPDVHNPEVDERLAGLGACAQVHLPSGRVCVLGHRHGGPCTFVPAQEAADSVVDHHRPG